MTTDSFQPCGSSSSEWEYLGDLLKKHLWALSQVCSQMSLSSVGLENLQAKKSSQV